MTREELNSVKDLKKKICGLEKDLRALRVAAENLVPILDGLPHSTLAQSRVEKIALKTVETEHEHERLCGLLPVVKAELADKIMRSGCGFSLQTLLILRYVECCSYKETAHRMKITLRHVFRLHEKFLKCHIAAQTEG